MSTTDTSGMLAIEYLGPVAILSLIRPAKRNAINDATILALRDFFSDLGPEIEVAIIQGVGEHFCAGLDLSEVRGRNAGEAMHIWRRWHEAFERIQFGPVPVITVLKGAVVGGGLEIAASTQIRIAEATAFYALPEAQRGLFLGGGGSVRIPRLIGVPCVTDMMLTGRVLNAAERHQAGTSQYPVGKDEGLAKSLELAERIAANAPLTNYGVMYVLPRVAEQSIEDGMMTEALMAAVAQRNPATQQRLNASVDGRANKIKQPS